MIKQNRGSRGGGSTKRDKAIQIKRGGPRGTKPITYRHHIVESCLNALNGYVSVDEVSADLLNLHRLWVSIVDERNFDHSVFR